MILTVTPNVALDITYRVDQLTPGSSHRVRRIEERQGARASMSREPSTRRATTPSSSGSSASNGEATLFNEAGPPVPATSWNDLEARLAARRPEATALVVSRSLPPGARDDACARLVRLAAAHRITVLVDAVGEALLRRPPPGPTS